MPAQVGARPSGNNIQLYKPLDVRDDGQAMELMGRLRKGVTIAAARAELDSIFARSEGITDGVLPFTTRITAPSDAVAFKDSLVLLFAAVALVLLVACANVAHLLLARGTVRRRELAIRAALGAGRGRILRLLLAESLLLALAGTAFGVLLGWAGLRTMVGVRPQSLDSLATAHLDTTTVFGAIAVALASGLIFGVIGALHSRRASTHDALKAGSPSIGRRNERARGLLVVSEMALSAVLLVGATLLIRTVINLQRADLGFDAHGLYAFHLDFRGNQIRDEPSRAAVMTLALPRLRALSGVSDVSVARAAPGFRPLSIGRLEIEGEPMPPADATSWIEINSVDRAYLSTMRMKLREGAGFVDTSAIGSGTPLMTSREVIVNASFARKHWQGSALGHRIRMPRRSTDAPAPWMTIVGVVNDAQTTGPMTEMTSPMLYVPRHDYSAAAVILVRASGGATSLAAGTALLKELGLHRIEPPESIGDTMARSIALPRFVMALLGVFSGFALILAAIGLYGVMAYSVAERTREIGIRVALGAPGARIAQNVIASGALLAALGAMLGMVAAAWGTRLIESQLFGLTRLDPQSFVTGFAVLFGVALIACIVPTRRALAVDPMTAIRAE
jgi:predicted permease